MEKQEPSVALTVEEPVGTEAQFLVLGREVTVQVRRVALAAIPLGAVIPVPADRQEILARVVIRMWLMVGLRDRVVPMAAPTGEPTPETVILVREVTGEPLVITAVVLEETVAPWEMVQVATAPILVRALLTALEILEEMEVVPMVREATPVLTLMSLMAREITETTMAVM